MEPNKEHIKLLVDDLMTTTAKQGRGRLRSIEEGYCCLGRGCEVFRKATGLGTWEKRECNGVDGLQYEFVVGQEEENASSQTLPQAVADWYGFEDGDPLTPSYEYNGRADAPVRATGLNDYFRLDFKQIAYHFAKSYLEGDHV